MTNDQLIAEYSKREEVEEMLDIKPIILTRKTDTENFFNCQYKRRMSTPTKKIGKRMVITAGFIPLKTRIENMIAAGLDLQTRREEMYPDMYDYEMDLLDENYDDDPDEITIIDNGVRAEEALQRRKIKQQPIIGDSEEIKPKKRPSKPKKSEELSEDEEI